MVLDSSVDVWRFCCESMRHTKESDTTMPKRKHDPAPKDIKGEVQLLLTGLVYYWEMNSHIVVYILFKYKGKETMPTGPEGIIEHGKPVGEKDLGWESIVKGKVKLSKHQQDVLVEVVAYHPADPTVSPSAMN